jgi:hypothetical protein
MPFSYSRVGQQHVDRHVVTLGALHRRRRGLLLGDAEEQPPLLISLSSVLCVITMG